MRQAGLLMTQGRGSVALEAVFASRLKRLLILGCAQGAIIQLVCLSICLPVCLPAFIFVCLSVCLYVYHSSSLLIARAVPARFSQTRDICKRVGMG